MLPRIGVVAPEAARAAIREAFLTHVIGGKGLSRGRGFAELVRAPTPDAVLRGVEVLADVVGGDVLVVDVGGATTDVYSVITPRGRTRRSTARSSARCGTPAPSRPTSACAGRRRSVVDGGARERMPLSGNAIRYAGAVAVRHRPPRVLGRGVGGRGGAGGNGRRRRRPPARSSAAPVGTSPAAGRRRPRRRVGRRPPPRRRGLGGRVLGRVIADHGGGWRVPEAACARVDTAYVLFAVGLLADGHPRPAAALARPLAAAAVAR